VIGGPRGPAPGAIEPVASRRRFLAQSLTAVLAGVAVLGPAMRVRSEETAAGNAPANSAPSTGLDLSNSSAPIEIEADEGIEWRRNEKVYIARGKARAARGDLEVKAVELSD